MIQWGYNTGSSTHTLTVYMPVSFYNSTYNVYGNIIKMHQIITYILSVQF